MRPQKPTAQPESRSITNQLPLPHHSLIGEATVPSPDRGKLGGSESLPSSADSNQPDQSSSEKSCGADSLEFQLNRRAFLFRTGATIAWLTTPLWLRSVGFPARVQAQVAEFERTRIASISELASGEPILFTYPWEHPNSTNYLLKLGQPAGGV